MTHNKKNGFVGNDTQKKYNNTIIIKKYIYTVYIHIHVEKYVTNL